MVYKLVYSNWKWRQSVAWVITSGEKSSWVVKRYKLNTSCNGGDIDGDDDTDDVEDNNFWCLQTKMYKWQMSLKYCKTKRVQFNNNTKPVTRINQS